MRKWILRLLVLAALVAVAVLLRRTVFAPKPLFVLVTTVGRGTVEATVTNSKAGTVKARRRAHLAPETGGRVVALPRAKGSHVKQGDILLQLDATSQEAQVTLARRTLDAALADQSRSCLVQAQSRRDLDRAQALAAERIVSTDRVEQMRSAADTAAAVCVSATAAAARARAAIVAAEIELAKAMLRAPFDGIVAELTVHVGEWTTPSPPGIPMPAVLDLLDPDSIYVSAPMDEVDSAKVRAGQPVRITLDPFPDQSFVGHVAHVAPYVLDVETQNRTVEIEVDLADHPFSATLLPGTSADVEVILDVRPDVLRIPTATLLEGKAVLMVRDGILERRELGVGLRNWNFTEITRGLAAGDRVVSTLDRAGVVSGAQVTIEEEGDKP